MAKNEKNKITIVQDHKKCIGCGTCAALCPKFWEMREGEGKAHLKGGEFDRQKSRYRKVFENMDEKDWECNCLARDACPVQAIGIK